MPDRLYLSCWVRGYSESNMLRHFSKLLGIFPFSKLAEKGPVLRVYAIEHAEPPLIEREFPAGNDATELLEVAREFTVADCTAQVDGYWDLWQFDGEWKLRPAAVTLSCYGPEFDNEIGDQLRIEFGLDSHFLPQPGIEGAPRMVQSNLRSLLHLIREADRALDLDRRNLWSESGANFADVLSKTLN